MNDGSCRNGSFRRRNEERLSQLREEIADRGRRALALPLDVADAAAIEAAADRVEQTLGPIDVWVNNAMVSVFSPVSEMTADEFRRVTEVTYLGGVYGTLVALRRMRARNRGSIVIVGSALAYRGIPLQSAYCAAKHALKGFNDSLQSELLHDRSAVRVTMVQLSAFNSRSSTGRDRACRAKRSRRPRVPPGREPVHLARSPPGRSSTGSSITP
jgi:NAD(P)-dependent dehydrogenase (short-subunit alcohol dehydrogenase family)